MSLERQGTRPSTYALGWHLVPDVKLSCVLQTAEGQHYEFAAAHNFRLLTAIGWPHPDAACGLRQVHANPSRYWLG